MNKEISVAFISNKLKEDFDALDRGRFEDRKLHEFINKAIDALKKDPDCGIKIPKKVWPRKYVLNYKITNLWKYDLPGA